jgi:hypothetical protein
MKIDSVCKGFLEISEQPDVILQEPPNPFEKFAEDAALAGSLGRSGWRHVENLKVEMAETEKRFAGLDHRSTVETRFEKRQLPDDLDAELTEPLEKGLSSESRRRASYRDYLKRAIADGETVGSLVAFAKAGGDHDTARLLASIGEELGL